MIDEQDRILLERLTDDARVSWAELAQEMELSAPAVAERVKRLRQRGLIRGFHAVLDPAALGLGLTAYIAVTLRHPRDRAEFLKTVRERGEVKEAHHLAGEDDYLLKVHCRDTGHLEHFLTDILKPVPGVQRTRTSIVLGTAKEMVTVLPPE
ncbi:MAG: Lrp/AsnC family transcriptional regulator [Acidobacteria bacterium]|nr:Lrp/AsnC family transcriptional regulator [Acidobacteriota bacterium]